MNEDFSRSLNFATLLTVDHEQYERFRQSKVLDRLHELSVRSSSYAHVKGKERWTPSNDRDRIHSR